MGHVTPGKGNYQRRRQGALERLQAHVKSHEDDEQLKRHLAEIETLKASK
ncbi:MAG: hypothetical protein Q7R33_07985 [Nitrosarchaeum sp.]|nr:hypothetical protein [Nitrosarchaeum sp.]